MAASFNLSTTQAGVGSVGLPIPRSMMSTPATRFSYFILLIRPNRYGGRRWMRWETSMLKLGSLIAGNLLDWCGEPHPTILSAQADNTDKPRLAQFGISELKFTRYNSPVRY